MGDFRKLSTKEFVRFLGYSLSSAWEAEGQLQRAIDFDLIKQSEFSALQEQVIDIYDECSMV